MQLATCLDPVLWRSAHIIRHHMELGELNPRPRIEHGSVNPLTTDDVFWRCQFLAACYQLVQSVLKIGSALAERVGQGEVGGCTPLADSAY